MSSLHEELTDDQRARLSKLTTEIRHDRITVSCSVEAGKRSAFYSVTASRDDGSSQVGEGASWGIDDLKIVRCLLCKHVVAATYDDAVKRLILPPAEAKEEALGILARYDAQIAKHLKNGA
jgi:hypothetical protein